MAETGERWQWNPRISQWEKEPVLMTCLFCNQAFTWDRVVPVVCPPCHALMVAGENIPVPGEVTVKGG